MNKEHVLNTFLIAILNGLYLLLFLFILCKVYLCPYMSYLTTLSISDYIMSNGRINPENHLEIISKEGNIKTQSQYLPGGTREND